MQSIIHKLYIKGLITNEDKFRKYLAKKGFVITTRKDEEVKEDFIKNTTNTVYGKNSIAELNNTGVINFGKQCLL